MTLGLTACFRGILGLLLLQPRTRKSAPRDVDEVGNRTLKLASQHEQQLRGRISQPTFDLGVVPQGDTFDVLLGKACQVPGVPDISPHQALKPLQLHGASLSVDATEDPTTIMTPIMKSLVSIPLAILGAASLMFGCDNKPTREEPAVTPVSEEPAELVKLSPTPSPQPTPSAPPKVDVEELSRTCKEKEDQSACSAACNAEHARSCVLLGLKLRVAEMLGESPKGVGLTKHKKACELGDGFGCYESKNYEKGLRLMGEACEKADDALSCRTLGFSYETGKRVLQNKKKAIELLSKACALGDEMGCFSEKRLKSE